MKISKKITWINIIYGILLFTVGILAFVFAIVSPEKVSMVVSYSIAACLFLLGITFILYALVEQTKDMFNMSLIIGSIAIALGTVLCIDTALVTSFFIYFLSILLIALGVVSLIKMFIAIKYKEKASWIVTYGVAGVIVITLGILGLVFIGPAERFIFGGLGIVLVILGVIEIVVGIKLLKNGKENIKTAKVEAIEIKKDAE